MPAAQLLRRTQYAQRRALDQAFESADRWLLALEVLSDEQIEAATNRLDALTYANLHAQGAEIWTGPQS